MQQTHNTPNTWLAQQYSPDTLSDILDKFPPFQALIENGDETFPGSQWHITNKYSGWGHADGHYVSYGLTHTPTPTQPYALYSLVGRKYHRDTPAQHITRRKDEDIAAFANFVQEFHALIALLSPHGLDIHDTITFTQQTINLINVRKKSGFERLLNYILRTIREPYENILFIKDNNLHDVPQQFPRARAMKRRWTFYVGPTNSGKTWHAMRDLMAAGSGTYLAPLRLMALEGQEKIQSHGVACSLRTGEERQDIEGANFTSSTIEMLDTEKPIGACIIDEIQVLNDPARGWAWTRALMGAPAEHLILTGSPDAIPTLQRLAKRLGDELTIVQLDRKTQLHPQSEPTEYNQLQPGDALIAFGRRQVLELKAQLEAQGYHPAVLYGALGPEVRRNESTRFSSGDADIVIATDVIGMGLNLPIKRVLFSAMTKYDGEKIQTLSGNEVRQIGGRAGRFGHHDEGQVGVLPPLDTEACDYIAKSLATPASPPEDTRAQIWAPWHAVEAMSNYLDTDNLYTILTTLYEYCLSDDPDLKVGNPKDQLEVARILDICALPLETKYNLLGAPLPIRSQQSVGRYLSWLGLQANDRPIDEHIISTLRAHKRASLEELESYAKMLVLYDWMALRYPQHYNAHQQSRKQRKDIDQRISDILAQRIAIPAM